MKEIIILDTVEYRYLVSDGVGEKFLEDKTHCGCIDSLMLDNLGKDNHFPYSHEPEIYHQDNQLNTFETVMEGHSLWKYTQSESPDA
jgi:hypothetical protein